jgi:hypothetical protein
VSGRMPRRLRASPLSWATVLSPSSPTVTFILCRATAHCRWCSSPA